MNLTVGQQGRLVLALGLVNLALVALASIVALR